LHYVGTIQSIAGTRGTVAPWVSLQAMDVDHVVLSMQGDFIN
jgi:hypothetical protein